MHSHDNLLFRLQLLVELDEASTIILKLKDPNLFPNTPNSESIESVFHELVAVLNIWRERLPNKNEDLFLWRDLFDQRIYINNNLMQRVKTIFQQNVRFEDPENEFKLSNFDDSSWNNLKFAQIERTYGYFKTISAIYKEEIKCESKYNFGGHEFYLKIKEMVKIKIIYNFKLIFR